MPLSQALSKPLSDWPFLDKGPDKGPESWLLEQALSTAKARHVRAYRVDAAWGVKGESRARYFTPMKPGEREQLVFSRFLNIQHRQFQGPPELSRREFLKNSAALAAVTAAGELSGIAPLRAAEAPAPRKTVGIQVGSVSFVDEGLGQVLDVLQARAAANTVFLTTFTYGRGLAGRQIPGHPFPDHGAQESDEKTFHGGNYARPHPEFYRNTELNELR